MKWYFGLAASTVSVLVIAVVVTLAMFNTSNARELALEQAFFEEFVKPSCADFLSTHGLTKWKFLSVAQVALKKHENLSKLLTEHLLRG